jgi:hypothetical protein
MTPSLSLAILDGANQPQGAGRYAKEAAGNYA